MAEKVTYVGIVAPGSSAPTDDNMADMKIPVPVVTGESLVVIPPWMNAVTLSLPMSVPRKAGTYANLGEDPKGARTPKWDSEWLGFITSVNGDHHTPNPCTHCWAGGTLTWSGESRISYKEQGKFSAASNVRCYDNWSPDKDDPTEYSLGVEFIAGNNAGRSWSIFNDGTVAADTSYYERRWGMRTEPGETPTYSTMNAGGYVSRSNANLYGPNYVTVSSDGSTATITFRAYRSWVHLDYHPDKLAQETRLTISVTVHSLTVRANGTATATITPSYVYSGWIAESSILPPKPDRNVSKSWTGSKITVPIASSCDTRKSVVSGGSAELAKALVTGHIGNLYQARFLKAQQQMINSSQQQKSARSEALRNQDALQSNWLENFSGFQSPIKLLEPVRDIGIGIARKDPKAIAKGLSAAYLSWKYVIAPAARDYEDVSQNAARLFKDHVSSSKEIITRQKAGIVEDDMSWTVAYSMKMDDNPWAKIWNSLCAFGIEPSAENLWALVPFSFVVDWFVPVSTALAECDAIINLSFNYNNIMRCESFRVTDTLTCTQPGWSGDLDFCYYKRIVGVGLGEITPFTTATSINPALTSSQMAQGISLIVQRLK